MDKEYKHWRWPIHNEKKADSNVLIDEIFIIKEILDLHKKKLNREKARLQSL